MFVAFDVPVDDDDDDDDVDVDSGDGCAVEAADNEFTMKLVRSARLFESCGQSGGNNDDVGLCR